MTKKRVTPSMNTPQMTLMPTTEPHNDMGQDMNCDVALPTDIQRHLGNLLKASYNDILTAPIPDRFVDLLNQLEQSPTRMAVDGSSCGSLEETSSSGFGTNALMQKKGC